MEIISLLCSDVSIYIFKQSYLLFGSTSEEIILFYIEKEILHKIWFWKLWWQPALVQQTCEGACIGACVRRDGVSVWNLALVQSKWLVPRRISQFNRATLCVGRWNCLVVRACIHVSLVSRRDASANMRHLCACVIVLWKECNFALELNSRNIA